MAHIGGFIAGMVLIRMLGGRSRRDLNALYNTGAEYSTGGNYRY
jgi:membrane associated rhomboid family serine protease